MKLFLILACIILVEGKPSFLSQGKPFNAPSKEQVLLGGDSDDTDDSDEDDILSTKLDSLKIMLKEIDDRLDRLEESMANGGAAVRAELEDILSAFDSLETSLQSTVSADFMTLSVISRILASLETGLPEGRQLSRLVLYMTSELLKNLGMDVDVASLLSGVKRMIPPEPLPVEETVARIRQRLEEIAQTLRALADDKQIQIVLLSAVSQSLDTYFQVTQVGYNFTDYVETVISGSNNSGVTEEPTQESTVSTSTTTVGTTALETTPFFPETETTVGGEGRHLSKQDIELLKKLAIRAKTKRLLKDLFNQ